METQVGEVHEEKSAELTVDLSKQTLKKLERANSVQELAETLILDDNELQKLDNLETYVHLKNLSLVNNQLFRMYGVSSLINLTKLDISNNSLVIIEGLKNLTDLKELNLSQNRIKSIEHLKSNKMLQKIDLSNNNIMYFSDISFLTELKELRLHSNKISHLTLCERYLPGKLEVFTIHNNLIGDLNEVSALAHLTSLKELCLLGNPCLEFSEDQKFNYRPFVKNWIGSLIILDNYPLDAIECLKAEWLYSQGRGRSFRVGEHTALIEYLNSVCPKEGQENAETEDVKKLKIILSKAQLHQQQLREQLSSELQKTSSFKKKVTPDRMVTSFQDSLPRDFKSTPEIMTRSLDSGMKKVSRVLKSAELNQTPLQTSTTFIPIPDSLISPDVGQPMVTSCPGPASASSRTSRSSSRNSPRSTPESKRKAAAISAFQRRCESATKGLRKSSKTLNSRASTPLDLGGSPIKSSPTRNLSSPGKKGSHSRASERHCRETSEDEESDAFATRVRGGKEKSSERKQNKKQQGNTGKKGTDTENLPSSRSYVVDLKSRKAAVCIQRWWRGYRARNLNGEVLSGCKSIQMNRMQDYITKVVSDMEATRLALEGNRRLVALQMQAINSLWKKLSSLQPNVASSTSENSICLQNLMETCSSLNKQVEGLQAMMKNIQASSKANYSMPIGTQTEIVAVHTPQGNEKKGFPYSPDSGPDDPRPSTPIDNSTEKDQEHPAESFRGSEGSSPITTFMTLTELHKNFNVEGTSSSEIFTGAPLDEKELDLLCVKLKKPSLGLNETKDTENIEKQTKSENICGS